MQSRGPKCHDHGITGYGALEPGGVVFVGIAPGENEQLKTKRPLTGPSGQLLDATLEACGWDRDNTYATNLLCWWKNAPDITDIMQCWPRLHDELQQLQPKLIIPLGGIATDFLLGNVVSGTFTHTPKVWGKLTYPAGEAYHGFTTRRGRTTWSNAFCAYVMPTYHPAAVLRGGGGFISDIVRDLSKIGLVINDFVDGGREADYTYTVVTSVREGQDLLASLPKGNQSGITGVALDIETNYGREDIDVFTEDLLCLSLTWGWDRTCVLPGHIAKQLDWSVTSGVHWIGQNFPFDSNGIRRWCTSHGIVDLPICEDTMFESYARDERPGKHRLEVIGGELCAAPMWKSALAQYTVTKSVPNVNGRMVRRRFREVPDDALYEYNAGDTTYTYRSHVRQRPLVTSDGMDRVYTELLIPAANAFKNIQYRGIYIDQQRQSELMVDWCELWLEQEERLNQIVHDADPTMPPGTRLNFRSPAQMSHLLYDTLGLPKQYAKQNTRGHAGAPKLTTNKDALEELYQYHDFCKEFHEWRQTDHQMSVSEGILSRVKLDGFLHATPMIHGTETGRLSYQDPNLQNISQDWMVGPNLARIREIFAPRDGTTHFIAEADYKQIELWMAQRWSNDVNMLTDLETGDFHRMTAMGVYHKTWDEVTKGDRFFTKMVTFGRLYERGAQDLTRGKSSLHCSIQEAEEWIREWSARYHGYVAWTKRLKADVIEEGTLVSPWGRKRRYYLIMGEEAHHQLRSALNFCMQSTAHDYTLSALIKLQPLLAQYDSYILLETHDSIMLEISRKYASEVMGLVTEVMQSVRPDPTWPTLTVEWKTGPNWGQAKEQCKVCHLMYPQVTVQEINNFLICTSCQTKQVHHMQPLAA